MHSLFFDTNAILYFLSDKKIKGASLADIEIAIFFITEIGLLCYPNPSVENVIIYEEFKRIYVK
ncbi:hypothetical protein [Persephonella sp.]|uniref:hypothetical protein n=1 Tax=Persephonella sp. TaxID=2060922 RepID=UPI00260D2524|nr:hypothetical protein [Persephonella sp.]